jgi:hypothetical protein
MRRHALLAVGLAALAASGCGSQATTAESVVAATQKQLRTVTSADIRLRVELGSTLGRTAQHAGFELAGPISLDPKKGPLADIRYRRLSSAAAATQDVEIVVQRTAGRIVVRQGGRTRTAQLSAAQIAELRAQVGGSSGGNGPLSRLHVASWVRHPRLVRHGALDTVTGEVDLETAVRDLLALGAAAGDVPAVSDDELSRLDGLVRSSRFDLVSRHADHVLRRLRIAFALAPGRRTHLGSVVVASGRFDLALARVNEPVRVP